VLFFWLSAKPSLLSVRKKRSAKPPALGKEVNSGSDIIAICRIHSLATKANGHNHTGFIAICRIHSSATTIYVPEVNHRHCLCI
jgi:hypothetical protein